MSKILFVCTGNVFRSLSADLALKSILPPGSPLTVSSAGTIGNPKPLLPDVKDRLDHWQVDYSHHVARPLTQALLDDSDLVIAMSTDHQSFIRQTFAKHVPLYYEVLHGQAKPFLDLHEQVPDYRINKTAGRAYIHQAIDEIFSNRHAFMQRLPLFLPAGHRGSAPPPPAP